MDTRQVDDLLRSAHETLVMEPDEVKDAMEKLGLSDAEFALVLGVASSRTVRRWEDGEKDVPASAIKLIDVLLHCPEARHYLRVGEYLPEQGYLSLFR